MTHEELIGKAREHVAFFEDNAPFEERVSNFERVTVQEVVLVKFDSASHAGHIRVFVDRASGDFITAEIQPAKDEPEDPPVAAEK